MANVKISNLTAATTPLAGTEVLPIVQSGATVKASIANVQTATYSGGTANGVAYLNGSKVLTTGSALSYNGSVLGITNTGDGGGKVTNSSTTGSGTWNLTNNSGSIVQLMLYGSAQGAYGAIGSGEASIYSTVSTTLMADSASGVIKFATGGNAEKMRLDASGRLLLGETSAPVTDASLSAFTTSTTDGAWSARIISRNQSNDTSVFMGNWRTNSSNKVAVIAAHNANLSGWGPLYVNTLDGTPGGDVVMGGNLLVGSTSTIGTGGRFQVTSSVDTSLFKCTSGTTYAAIVSNVESTAARLMAFQYGSGGSPTNVGTITTNGTGVTYGTSSDYRLKENIAPMIGALDKVAQLKPVTYKWKANGSDGQGFIAHELKEVVSDAVQGEKDAVDEDGNPVYQGIDTSYLVATLTAAIQEQQALITQLTARITALESA